MDGEHAFSDAERAAVYKCIEARRDVPEFPRGLVTYNWARVSRSKAASARSMILFAFWGSSPALR